MLATSIVPAWAVTQSIPQMIDEIRPAAVASSTRTAHSRAPGATPTTPIVVVLGADDAGDVRAVAVAVVVGRLPGDAVDAADDVEVGVVDVDAGVDDGDVDVDRAAAVAARRPSSRSPPTRSMPAGTVWAVMLTSRSGTTAATPGSLDTALRAAGVSRAEKPRSACR